MNGHSFRIHKLINNSIQCFRKCKILIVGVGGIGCELLKILSKWPLHCIHIIDMDTIQVFRRPHRYICLMISNLNRQFLFKAQHRGKSKAYTAQQAIKQLNPSLDIVAHHKNIKQLPIPFFQQFTIIVLALDNVDARNYVNKIAMRLNIVLIDAGTLGYKGNATSMHARTTKCYACEPKATTQKQYPVCTIRMRPDKPIHCIVWAKMLLEVMFSKREIESDMKDMAALALHTHPLEVMRILFCSEINDIANAVKKEGNKRDNIRAIAQELLLVERQGAMKQFKGYDREQGIEVWVGVFKQAYVKLKSRGEQVQFEKDDEEIIHFISSTANLRMHCFSIPTQSFNEIKNIAGNIVPAIASTNAIVAGLQAIEIGKLITNNDNLRSYFVQNQHNKIIALKLQPPIPTCQICMDPPITIRLDFLTHTLHDLVKNMHQLKEFSINMGSKEVYNSQEPREEVLRRKMCELGGDVEVELVVTDEETSQSIGRLWLYHVPNAIIYPIVFPKCNKPSNEKAMHVKQKQVVEDEVEAVGEDEVQFVRAIRRGPSAIQQQKLKRIKRN